MSSILKFRSCKPPTGMTGLLAYNILPYTDSLPVTPSLPKRKRSGTINQVSEISSRVLRALHGSKSPSKVCLKTWERDCECSNLPDLPLKRQFVSVPSGCVARRKSTALFKAPSNQKTNRSKKHSSYTESHLNSIVNGCNSLKKTNDRTREEISNGLVHDLQQIRNKYSPKRMLFKEEYIERCVKQYKSECFMVKTRSKTFKYK